MNTDKEMLHLLRFTERHWKRTEKARGVLYPNGMSAADKESWGNLFVGYFWKRKYFAAKKLLAKKAR